MITPPPKPPNMLQRLWLRVRSLVARLFRLEVAPGRFEAGRASSVRGFLTTAPFVPAIRDYLVYVPRGHTRLRRAPLVVLCHGCRETPEDIAGLTRLTEHADRQGWLVLLPRQADSANAFHCWNWFESNTSRGAGEAAIVAAQIVAVRRHYRARRERVWVAGLSAGAALAAVLGLRYPRLVRGVLAHSGLACGAASSPATALTVMRHGPDNDVARVADDARATAGNVPLRVTLLVIQGNRDDVVAPINGVGLVDQFLRFNEHPAGGEGYRPAAALPPADATAREAGSGGRHGVRVDDWSIDGRVCVRHVAVEGMGHAWSGGNADYAFADPLGPDALELLVRLAASTAA
jgi:poly(3-hydroxybutyrate) depolymerase